MVVEVVEVVEVGVVVVTEVVPAITNQLMRSSAG